MRGGWRERERENLTIWFYWTQIQVGKLLLVTIILFGNCYTIIIFLCVSESKESMFCQGAPKAAGYHPLFLPGMIAVALSPFLMRVLGVWIWLECFPLDSILLEGVRTGTVNVILEVMQRFHQPWDYRFRTRRDVRDHLFYPFILNMRTLRPRSLPQSHTGSKWQRVG